MFEEKTDCHGLTVEKNNVKERSKKQTRNAKLGRLGGRALKRRKTSREEETDKQERTREKVSDNKTMQHGKQHGLKHNLFFYMATV